MGEGSAKLRLRSLDISRVLLALLIVSINIREPFFHSREILFALTILMSVPRMNFSETRYACVLVFIWANSLLFNILALGSSFALNGSAFETVIVSAYLLLLCFCSEYYAKTIVASYLFVSAIVASIIALLWVSISLIPSLYDSLRLFFLDLRASTGLSLISIDYRAILGTKYLTVWYRTSPCMICALGFLLFRRLKGKRGAGDAALCALLAAGLVFSGTRANIICVFLLMASYAAFRLHQMNYKVISVSLLAIGASIAVYFGIRFLNDAGSASSAIKLGDAGTYLDIFASDPLRSLLFGWGCGSDFFSLGRNEIVNVTELSFFETIRRYGLLSTAIIIGFIWLSPLWSSRAGESKSSSYSRNMLLITLFCYLFVAGTNPYLLDSVGFCALLFLKTSFQFGTDEMEGRPKTIRNRVVSWQVT